VLAAFNEMGVEVVETDEESSEEAVVREQPKEEIRRQRRTGRCGACGPVQARG
jgi:hypothetical protein